MIPRIVLDSYAILAYLEKEPGGLKVKEILEASKKKRNELYLSIINLAEVYYQTIRGYGVEEAKIVISLVRNMPLIVISASDDLVFKSAEIKSQTPISLADCFAISLAIEKKASILTGDPEFKKVEKQVKIFWLI